MTKGRICIHNVNKGGNETLLNLPKGMKTNKKLCDIRKKYKL